MREIYFYSPRKSQHAFPNSEPIKRLVAATSLPLGEKPSSVQKTINQAAELEALSNGRLTLLDLRYRGDDERHLVVDKNCGHKFRTSFHEIRTHGIDHSCPWCSTPHSLDQFYSLRDLQQFVVERSHSNAYLCSPTEGRRIDSYASFYCLIHRYIYQAKFSTFLRWAGSTNACPGCSLAREVKSGEST